MGKSSLWVVAGFCAVLSFAGLAGSEALAAEPRGKVTELKGKEVIAYLVGGAIEAVGGTVTESDDRGLWITLSKTKFGTEAAWGNSAATAYFPWTGVAMVIVTK